MKQDERKAFEQRILKTYRVFHSTRETARLCGTNKDAVSVVLRQYGEPRPKIKIPIEKYAKRKSNGKISRWLRENASRKLPRDYKHLAEVIGVSYGALRNYFYRRRLSTKRLIAGLPDLKSMPGITLVSLDGRIFEVSEADSYQYVLDRFTLEVHISAKLHTGEHVLCPVTDLRAFASALKAIKR